MSILTLSLALTQVISLHYKLSKLIKNKHLPFDYWKEEFRQK